MVAHPRQNCRSAPREFARITRQPAGEVRRRLCMRIRIAAITAALALCLWATSAQAGSDFGVAPAAAPPGTTITITGASDRVGDPEHCPSDVTMALAPLPLTGDIFHGETPFRAPNGTYTVPDVPAGDYGLVVLCGGFIADDIVFHVDAPANAVSGRPNFAG
jgi:hypothetical protein